MAKFRQYNIQLLPLDTKKTPEVGIQGYEKLFDLLKQHTAESYKAKKMATEAMPLVHDTFICPFVIHTESQFAYGSFIKFHKAETVTEFYTQERLFEAPSGSTAVVNTFYFRFIFDYANHRFGIEEKGGRLPSPDVMLRTLEHFLQPLAQRYFFKHTFSINLISDERSLNEVLAEGNEFGSVHVKIAFPNSRRLNDTLRELKDLNAHSIEANVGPAKGARMSGLPQYVKDLIRNASELGEATITFFKAIPGETRDRIRRLVYSTKHHPRWMTLRQKAQEAEQDFIRRAWVTMKGRAERESE